MRTINRSRIIERGWTHDDIDALLGTPDSIVPWKGRDLPVWYEENVEQVEESLEFLNRKAARLHARESAAYWDRISKITQDYVILAQWAKHPSHKLPAGLSKSVRFRADEPKPTDGQWLFFVNTVEYRSKDWRGDLSWRLRDGPLVTHILRSMHIQPLSFEVGGNYATYANGLFGDGCMTCTAEVRLIDVQRLASEDGCLWRYYD